MKRTREEEKNHYFFFCLSLNCTHCCCCFPFLHIRLQFFFKSFVFCCCWPECSLIDYNSVWGERWAGDNNLRNVNMKRENVECSHGSHIYMREKSIELYVHDEMIRKKSTVKKRRIGGWWALVVMCAYVYITIVLHEDRRRCEQTETKCTWVFILFFSSFYYYQNQPSTRHIHKEREAHG